MIGGYKGMSIDLQGFAIEGVPLVLSGEYLPFELLIELVEGIKGVPTIAILLRGLCTTTYWRSFLFVE